MVADPDQAFLHEELQVQDAQAVNVFETERIERDVEGQRHRHLVRGGIVGKLAARLQDTGQIQLEVQVLQAIDPIKRNPGQHGQIKGGAEVEPLPQ